MSDKNKSIEYCCVWCHKALSRDKTYVNTRNGSTVCGGCRGLGVILNKFDKPCKRLHFYGTRQSDSAVDATTRGEEGQAE